MMDWGVRWSIASLRCGVWVSDLMLRRGISNTSAVAWVRREAKRNSIVVASSDTIASVPRAWGLVWALKCISIRNEE